MPPFSLYAIMFATFKICEPLADIYDICHFTLMRENITPAQMREQ
jgi:hypothetical protein